MTPCGSGTLNWNSFKGCLTNHVAVIMNMITQRSFILSTSTGESTGKRFLKNGVPQGPVLVLTLFNIYISDMAETAARKYNYTDDLALTIQHLDKAFLERGFSSDMDRINNYFHQWRLTLSEAETTASFFHLNNHAATQQLCIQLQKQELPFNSHPVFGIPRRDTG